MIGGRIDKSNEAPLVKSETMPTTIAPGGAVLGRTLRTRHVTMIAIGGIIGAGLFVGSSTSIATVGPAVIFSYGIAGLVILMIMRMLSEMAMASPGTGTKGRCPRGSHQTKNMPSVRTRMA